MHVRRPVNADVRSRSKAAWRRCAPSRRTPKAIRPVTARAYSPPFVKFVPFVVSAVGLLGCFRLTLCVPLWPSVVKGLFRLFDLPRPAGAATTKNPAGGTRPGAFALGERSGTTAAQHHRQRAQTQQTHRRRLRDRNRGPVRSEAIRPHHRRIIHKEILWCGGATGKRSV